MKAKQELEALLLDAIKDGAFPGANYAIVTKEKTWFGSLGNRELYPEIIPNSIDTIYDMASLTKVVNTTTCAMQLVEKGLLRIFDPVSRYFSQFRFNDVTVWHLLTHTSGLPEGIYGPKDRLSPQDVWDKIFAIEELMYKKRATTLEIDLGELKSTVAFPHLPENAHIVGEFDKIYVDQSVIGSCTNGRIEDMRAAAEVLKGKKVNENVRCIVIPATQNVYLQCVREGLAEIFVEAGAVFSTPTCGPCLGGHMGILAAEEKAISTTNRNFVGRMGHPTSEVYLASPYVAAASAIAGYICTPEEVL